MKRLTLMLCCACTAAPIEVNVIVPAEISSPTVDMSAVQVGEPGIHVSPTSGLSTTASGGTSTFKVVLQSRPSDSVTIGLSSSDTTQGTVAPNKLVFTSDNWDAAQVVTITGVDDEVVSGDHAYFIRTARAVSSDENYFALDAPDVSVVNLETDTPGFAISPTSGLTTTFGGAPAKFTVHLKSQPMDDVTLALTSSDVTQGTVSPASLTFNTANFKTAQTVTVTAVDDQIANGDKLFSIVTAKAVSSDAHYNDVDPDDVTVTNHDTDVAGITVTPTSGLITTESGGTDSFSVVLTSKPTATVTIGITSSNTAHGTVNKASLSYDGSNWFTAQAVTVTGHDDGVITGDQSYSIVTAAAASTDPVYNGRNPADVSVTSTSTAQVLLSPSGGLVTAENGKTDSFTVRLSTQPTQSVTINLTSSNTGFGTVNPASIVFNTAASGAGSWIQPQTVTVTGKGDPGNTTVDGNHGYTIQTSAAVSGDSNYSGLAVSDVGVTNLDDDVNVYGSRPGVTNSMVWCSPKGSCPADSALLLVPVLPGGTVNFFITNSGDQHGGQSLETGPPSWFPANSILLGLDSSASLFAVTTPAILGSHKFDCWVHGSAMPGNICVTNNLADTSGCP